MKSTFAPVKVLGIVFTFLCAMSLSANSFAGESPLHTMAKILIGLNHYPSDSEKQTLKAIVSGSASSHQKTIATSMINLQHKAQGSDIPKLKAITSDGKASKGEKDLATILLGLSHSPSSSDKSTLKSMM